MPQSGDDWLFREEKFGMNPDYLVRQDSHRPNVPVVAALFSQVRS